MRGALWNATRASPEKGRIAWAEIVENLAAAIREEMPADDARPPAGGSHRRALEGLEQVT